MRVPSGVTGVAVMAPSKRDVAAVIILITLVLLVNPVLKAVSGTDTPLAVVRGSSMLPLLREGDVVVLEKKGPDQIEVNDIIVYRSLKGHLIIHRVIDVKEIGGVTYYVTKGDNNPTDDSYLYEYPRGKGVTYDRIVGVVWSPFGMPFKIPYLGAVTLFLRT